jgi:hypothetical protein
MDVVDVDLGAPAAGLLAELRVSRLLIIPSPLRSK